MPKFTLAWQLEGIHTVAQEHVFDTRKEAEEHAAAIKADAKKLGVKMLVKPTVAEQEGG